MLKPDEVMGVTLGDAKGFAFAVSFSGAEGRLLVTDAEDPAMAVMLDGSFAFTTFNVAEAARHKVALVEKVRIEVNQDSIYNAAYGYDLGDIVRVRAEIGIVAKPSNARGFNDPFPVTLVTGLPAGRDDVQVGFKRWSITIGSGLDRRVLFTREPNETE